MKVGRREGHELDTNSVLLLHEAGDDGLFDTRLIGRAGEGKTNWLSSPGGNGALLPSGAACQRGEHSRAQPQRSGYQYTTPCVRLSRVLPHSATSAAPFMQPVRYGTTLVDVPQVVGMGRQPHCSMQ